MKLTGLDSLSGRFAPTLQTLKLMTPLRMKSMNVQRSRLNSIQTMRLQVIMIWAQRFILTFSRIMIGVKLYVEWKEFFLVFQPLVYLQYSFFCQYKSLFWWILRCPKGPPRGVECVCVCFVIVKKLLWRMGQTILTENRTASWDRASNWAFDIYSHFLGTHTAVVSHTHTQLAALFCWSLCFS